MHKPFEDIALSERRDLESVNEQSVVANRECVNCCLVLEELGDTEQDAAQVDAGDNLRR